MHLVPVMVDRPPRVAILGLGYVGLPTALALLEAGTDVVGIDVSSKRLAAIRSRRVDLSPLDHGRLAKALRGHRLSLSRRSVDLAGAETVIVAVPTPVDENLTPDLSILEAACASVVAAARAGQTIILTSTSYVGCTRDLLVRPLGERGLTVGEDIFVAFSPERIDPGNTEHTQSVVPRIVGGLTPECVRRAAAIVGRIAPVHEVSSVEAAEMTKLFARMGPRFRRTTQRALVWSRAPRLRYRHQHNVNRPLDLGPLALETPVHARRADGGSSSSRIHSRRSVSY